MCILCNIARLVDRLGANTQIRLEYINCLCMIMQIQVYLFWWTVEADLVREPICIFSYLHFLFHDFLLLFSFVFVNLRLCDETLRLPLINILVRWTLRH